MAKKKKITTKTQALAAPVSKGLSGTFWLILILAVLASVMVLDAKMLRERQTKPALTASPVAEQQKLQIGDSELLVEIRDDDAERAQGLSGREGLSDGEGMLFIFEEAGTPVFWMKDMKFALDVVWMTDGLIVQVDENVPPPTVESPKIETMVPRQPIDMVLEVPAGWVLEHGVRVGDEARLILNEQ